MAKGQVKPQPRKPPRDGRGLGERNPECERNKQGLPRMGKNRRPRPK